MKTSKLMVLLLSTIALTGCVRGSGKSKKSYKEVSYEEFHEKAVKAFDKVSEAGYTLVTVKGFIKTSDTDIDVDTKFDVKDGVPAPRTEEIVVFSIASMNAAAVPGDEETVYYVGSSGFKVTLDEEEVFGEAIFDKYGLMTSYKTEYVDQKMELTLKWSK